MLQVTCVLTVRWYEGWWAVERHPVARFSVGIRIPYSRGVAELLPHDSADLPYRPLRLLRPFGLAFAITGGRLICDPRVRHGHPLASYLVAPLVLLAASMH